MKLMASETPRDLEVSIATMDNRKLLRRCLLWLQAAFKAYATRRDTGRSLFQLACYKPILPVGHEAADRG